MTARRFAGEAEIEAVGRGLIACDYPPAQFDHAAHWAAALWLLRQAPAIDAARDMPGFIRRFNVAAGGANTDTDGYHETITRASIRAAAHTLAEALPDAPLHEVCNRLLETPLGRSDWTMRYWTKARLFSVEARRRWVEPDIRPLPWPEASAPPASCAPRQRRA